MVGLCLLFGLPLIQLNDVSYRLGQRLIQRQPMWLFDGASENALWDGLELANTVACVKDLPQGIDTVLVGSRTYLSGLPAKTNCLGKGTAAQTGAFDFRRSNKRPGYGIRAFDSAVD